MKRYDASLEWLVERMFLRDKEMDDIRQVNETEERMKKEMLQAMKIKSAADVLEEVEVVIDTHFFNEFSETTLLFPEKGLREPEYD